MNAFDYFFEKTHELNRPFLVGDQEVTFQELYNRSLILAAHIREQFGTGQNILLLSPNNIFFMVVYLAAMKSGNTIIPLDPMIDKGGYRYISDLTHPAMVFCTEQVMQRLSIKEQECLLPGSLPEGEPESLKDFSQIFNGDTTAEIIFTSGSTGIPKGVMLSHKNLIANTTSILEYLELTAKDRMLVVLPFYYCYGLSLLHTHLRIGGSIVFNNAFIFLGGVINDLKQYRCTGFAGVPSHFQILLRKSDSFKTTEFPDLKYVTQAGGKLAPLFIDEFREAHPTINFIVMYGQTEATARLSYLPVELYEKKKGSIGRGIPGVTLRVVNENGEDVRPGETGEVIARGDNVMSGYFRDQEGTNKTLREGWLHTGDLGTVDKDGFIFLTARSKEIIKVGGKRISPKEIESVILSIPTVVDCTIEGVEDELLGESIKATVIQNKSAKESLSEEYIKEHCAQHLAMHKVPQLIDIKDRLHMSATGKKIKKN